MRNGHAGCGDTGCGNVTPPGTSRNTGAGTDAGRVGEGSGAAERELGPAQEGHVVDVDDLLHLSPTSAAAVRVPWRPIRSSTYWP